ncbi:MAG: hypothetical protein QGH42_13465 [Kiritimatiellia bacterium]|jgi:hypothetical protein|nr:hypothetical protein [Kiritimatiellia bacterium]MDP7025234.1 hypothetical protein [Kiritimatiellia bacterium]
MKRIAIPLFVVLALIGGLCFVGCETESASQNNVLISPRSAIILIDNTVELTASGGFDYEWSLEQEEWGTLSTTKGSRTVYTSAHDPDPETWQEHQVITVKSYINRQAGGTNGFSDYAQTAEAIITHQTAQVIVNIEPPNANVTEFGSVSFTATGANRYSWSLQYPSWGTLTATDGDTTTYTSTFNPSDEHLQILTCTTDRGTTTAHIVHNAEGIILNPSSASLNEGESVKFTASGGTTYSWSKTGTGNELTSFSTTTGSETTLSFPDGSSFSGSRSFTVTVTSGEESAQSSVTIHGTL